MVECPPDDFLAKSATSLDEIVLAVPRNPDYLHRQIGEDVLDPLMNQHLHWLFTCDPSVDRKGILEYGLRELLNKYAQQDITSSDKSCALIDLSLALSSHDHVEQTLPHALLEVVFDLHPVDWCQIFFSYVESRETQFAKNLNGNRAPGTTIIRFSNGLLRRLSKTLHLNFAGRILIFLARAFPITEISGLNPKGDYDVENVTKWDAETDSSGKSTFYSTFWSLQPIFANPLQLFEGPGNQIELLNIPLQECFSNLLPHITSKSGTLSLQQNDDDDDDGKLQYMPKWLTDKGLFELELQDVSFRRVFYAQVHILFDFLFSLTSEHKQAWSKLSQPLNKSISYSFTLSERDHRFYTDILRRFFLDSKFSENDARFFNILRAILVNDSNWVAWKLQNQKPFSRPSLTQQDLQDAEKKFEANKRNRQTMRFAMGTPAITQLWKVETGLDTLKSRKRKYPTPEDMFEKIKRDKHTITDFFSTDEEKQVATQVLPADYWRTLRVARNTDYWCQFSNVKPLHGVPGLFEQPPPPPPAPVKSEVEDELGSKAGTPLPVGTPDEKATGQPTTEESTAGIPNEKATTTTTATEEITAVPAESSQSNELPSTASGKTTSPAEEAPNVTQQEIPSQVAEAPSVTQQETPSQVAEAPSVTQQEIQSHVTTESEAPNVTQQEIPSQAAPEAAPHEEEKMDLDEPEKENSDSNAHASNENSKKEPSQELKQKQQLVEDQGGESDEYEPHFAEETTLPLQEHKTTAQQQPGVEDEQITVNKPQKQSEAKTNAQLPEIEQPLEQIQQQDLNQQHQNNFYMRQNSEPIARNYHSYNGRQNYSNYRSNSFGYRPNSNGRFNNSQGMTWDQLSNSHQEENGNNNMHTHGRGGFNNRGYNYNPGFRGGYVPGYGRGNGRGGYGNYRYNNGTGFHQQGPRY